MRTYKLIFATLALLGGAFWYYWSRQPPTTTQVDITRHPEPATKPTTQKYQGLTRGTRPWITFINSDGKVSSQYRAEEYQPRPDGTVRMLLPEAEFFLGQHQRLHVTGADGDVVMRGNSNLGLGGGGSQPSGRPSRGRLNDVEMTLIDETISSNPVTVMTMTTNNIEFDNESFLITTGGYTAPDGTQVPPDQVPVKVRGVYDFDGRGLTLRWNDQDDRLELLEIAHGEKLQINQPSSRNGPLAGGAGSTTKPQPEAVGSDNPTDDQADDSFSAAGRETTPIPKPSSSAAVLTSPKTGQEGSEHSASTHAGAGNAATSPTTRAASQKRPKAPRPVYLATFDDAVRITQGNAMLMTGDLLKMHFKMKEEENKSTTRPSGAARESGKERVEGSGNPENVGWVYPPTSCLLSERWAGTPTLQASGTRTLEVFQTQRTRNVLTGNEFSADRSETSSVQLLPLQSATRGASLIPVKAPVAPALADVPVIVRWTGKLKIVPELAPPRPILPGDSIMELIGVKSPVFVFRAASEDSPASEIRCAALSYVTADGSASLTGSPEFGQVRLIRRALESSTQDDPAPPTVIDTDVLDYVPLAHSATLTGVGHAVIPLAQNPGEKQAAVDAKWSKQATFDFLPRGNDEMAIKSAAFLGDVVITHPQLGLNAQQLTLLFSPAAATATRSSPGQSPALSEVIATDRADHVHCRLVDAAGKQQTIDCQSLDLRTSRTTTGRVLARRVDAVGNVHASDGAQELDCDHVQMMLRPAIEKARAPAQEPAGGVDTSAVELERLDARGSVVITAKDGAVAKSDELLVAMDSDGPHMMLTGGSLCKIIDAKKNELSGEKIVIQPRQQLAHVIGSGTLHSVGEQAKESASGAAATSRKMDVIFSDGADMDGGGNQINLRGKVVVTMPDSDGSINTAQADRIRIDLQNKPQPATRAVAATRPTDDMNLMGNKEPAEITLDGNAIVQSNLSDATGILRQFELKAPRIIYAVAADTAQDLPAHTLVVPSAGVMLVRDHRAPASVAGADDTGFGSGRGATAFKWTRRLTYNEDARKAIMSGDVLVVHESDNAKELPVQMTADEVTAFFQPSPGKGTATKPSGASQALEMKSMEAVGNVVVNRGPTQINAQRIYFEPASHWMTAQGTPQSPVNVIDEKGAQSTVDEARWNTQTWDFVMKHAGGQGRR